jgi:periplasmic protein CpxP/Spy
MSYLTSRASASSPARRLTAIAGLLGAALLLPVAATAGTMPAGHHSRHQTSAERAETVEMRITKLHTDLRITPSEEASWTPVAQVMRDNEMKMQAMITAKKAEPPHDISAVEDLKNYEMFNQAHVDGLKTLISSFEVLYMTMPDDQKHLADDVFRKFGHRAESHS